MAFLLSPVVYPTQNRKVSGAFLFMQANGKDSFYFQHDTNASQDEKIMGLLKDHGLEGLALFWIMVELIHQQPDGSMKIDAFDSNVQMYAGAFGKDKERLFNVRSTFVQRGLFKEENGTITSERILRNKAYREKLSNAGRVGGQASANKRLRTIVQAYKGKERKGKENIVSKVMPPEPLKQAFNDFLEMRKKLRAPATERAQEIILKQLSEYPIETAKKMLEQSTERSWRGVFELKENKSASQIMMEEENKNEKTRIS